MVRALKRLEQSDADKQINVIESDRVILERAAYEKAGYVYPEDDFRNRREREFLYFKDLFPDRYWCWIDQVWRVLDERDGQEYIMYHAYHYVDQEIKSPDGHSNTVTHEFDDYYGFWHRPIVKVKSFHPDGTVNEVSLQKLEKVYTIKWSKKALDAILDALTMKGTCNQFALGLAATDASLTTPPTHSTQVIKNREDFSNYSFDETTQLGRSQLSTSVPSMQDIQRTLDLRRQALAKAAKLAQATTAPTTTTTMASSSK